MVFPKAKPQLIVIQKLRTSFPNLLKTEVREATDIVFSVLLIFMLTCVGSMLLICFCFEMERRSPTSQPLAQPNVPSTSSTPVK